MNVNYVSTGKPRTTGSIYRAPIGSILPTDAKTELDAAFVELGYVSDDGMTNSNPPDTDTKKAWGGLVVLVLGKGREDTFKFTLMESINVDVLKAIYGDDNVTGDLETGITVKANNNYQDSSCWVIDMVLRNDVMERLVIPNAMLSDLGDITYKDDEAIGYETTITALPDDSGNTHYDYSVTKTAA